MLNSDALAQLKLEVSLPVRYLSRQDFEEHLKQGLPPNAAQGVMKMLSQNSGLLYAPHVFQPQEFVSLQILLDDGTINAFALVAWVKRDEPAHSAWAYLKFIEMKTLHQQVLKEYLSKHASQPMANFDENTLPTIFSQARPTAAQRV